MSVIVQFALGITGVGFLDGAGRLRLDRQWLDRAGAIGTGFGCVAFMVAHFRIHCWFHNVLLTGTFSRNPGTAVSRC